MPLENTCTVNSPSAAGAPPLTRREFLNYLLAGSLGLLALESCGAATWFALPKIEYGESSGFYKLDPKSIPYPGQVPIGYPAGKFWLSNGANGLLVLAMSCSWDVDRCLYKWVPSNQRFECPCCGSKYRPDGTQVEGPARRGLDRYMIEVTTPKGVFRTSKQGEPVDISEATSIIVNTQVKISGPPRG